MDEDLIKIKNKCILIISELGGTSVDNHIMIYFFRKREGYIQFFPNDKYMFVMYYFGRKFICDCSEVNWDSKFRNTILSMSLLDTNKEDIPEIKEKLIEE